MIKLIQSPSTIKAAGNMPKIIKEYFGRENSGTTEISIARMDSPQGWQEPGQTRPRNLIAERLRVRRTSRGQGRAEEERANPEGPHLHHSSGIKRR